eukprot:2744955-Prymnesium_polylepis.1
MRGAVPRHSKPAQAAFVMRHPTRRIRSAPRGLFTSASSQPTVTTCASRSRRPDLRALRTRLHTRLLPTSRRQSVTGRSIGPVRRGRLARVAAGEAMETPGDGHTGRLYVSGPAHVHPRARTAACHGSTRS